MYDGIHTGSEPLSGAIAVSWEGSARGSLELEGLVPACAFHLLFSWSLGNEGLECCEQGLQKGLWLWGWEHAGCCPGCSSQSVWQFESLLSVLLGTASGTFASRLLLEWLSPVLGGLNLSGAAVTLLSQPLAQQGHRASLLKLA